MAQVFSCEFCEISNSTFSQRTPLVATSILKKSLMENFIFYAVSLFFLFEILTDVIFTISLYFKIQVIYFSLWHKSRATTTCLWHFSHLRKRTKYTDLNYLYFQKLYFPCHQDLNCFATDCLKIFYLFCYLQNHRQCQLL